MLKNKKIIIKGMSLLELKKWCVSLGETAYRGSQIYEWLYKKSVTDFDSMLNLSHNFRNFLKKNTILSTVELYSKNNSNLEETVKYLFKLNDGHFIETVSMIRENRHIVCLSSQVGCNVDCDFCATGKMGFLRNLSVGEIIDQLIYVRNNIKSKITNIVFMGMGEPFLNYNRVLTSADIFHDPKGFNLARHRITISTAGILPKIKQYINENRKYKLAISLNASNNKIRNKIMPINNNWKIEQLIKEGKRFSLFKRRVVMFEYVLISGVNDSSENALELATLLKGINCKLNIIPYNDFGNSYKRPSENSLNNFLNILYKNQNNFRILVRWSKGQDINAGCGQLIYKKNL